MQIQEYKGSVIVNDTPVEQQGYSFESGIVEAKDESSEAIISMLDGDILILSNGKTNIQFAESESIMAMLGEDSKPDINLNLRHITLETGTLHFKLKPKQSISKVTYRLFVNDFEIHFKDADLTINHKNGGELTVLRGEVTIVTMGTNKEPLKVKAGNTINLTTAH